MIIVGVDTARIVITGHAPREVCAQVSSVAAMLRLDATVWHHGRTRTDPSLVIAPATGEIAKRVLAVLKALARQYPTHVRFEDGR